MYQNKLVAAIKVGGQILRESGDTVTIPFGSEYSVLLKNLNSRRVQVKVSVDGKDATEGTWLIIAPNSSIELERFISGGNLSSGNRFKFIERTEAIENYRGIKAEDGLIRVEYRMEKKPVVVDETVVRRHYRDYYHEYYRPWYTPYYPVYPLGTVTYQSTADVSCFNSGNVQSSGNRAMAMNCSVTPTNDAGITVPGSHSDQKFQSVSGFDTHESQVLVLKLRGTVKGKAVKTAVTVKSRSLCPTCGTKSKKAEYCPKCGTNLSAE